MIKRSNLNGFAPLRAVRFVVLALAALVGGAGAASVSIVEAAPTQDVGATARAGTVHRIPVEREIELGLAAFIERGLREAEETGASAVILDIDTPGGRLDAAQQIVVSIAAAEMPVYALVNPHAFSAGAMIALATDGIYMVPGGVIGAATPVDGEGRKGSEKMVERNASGNARPRRGARPRSARRRGDGRRRHRDPRRERGRQAPHPDDRGGGRVGYATAVDGWDDLLATLDLADAEVHYASVNWAESVVRFLTNPIVAPLLLSLGFLGLILEFKTPTFGLVGLAGGLSLALFFGSHFLVGLAGWEHVILLGVGLVLLAVEIFIVPGFGIFGLSGIVAVLVSIYMILLGALGPGGDYATAATSLSAAVLISAVTAWALGRFMARSPRLRRSGIMLGEATSREAGYISATVRTDLRRGQRCQPP